ncbi:MAG: 50S ribosomal protein L10 [Spirochaetes bacterium GWF1_31_7]|nr:MAG: 50S ribosomal protein L10 [Spirochaetes bacterium GWE1_32_154]OHD47328.1 MAG: 50S ribosomal protein L10 [Spirochaetes bacterium GWE2_31_10]OHD53193.1 MAG: 50S ribosomal protein L10 [Spirochaetes bacterium GWF1_31_7]OHD78376.1 MAG: 50S ribosomal protein L10 [Spirochaetes bacterium RIFOXYB1_FULL_32_8]HBD95004.1 50S ribosomal protein L10 [Spirochaetia bacterium]
MPKQYKLDKVNDLKKYFDKSEDFIFTDYRGLSVDKLSKLRRELTKVGSKYMVMKNNYINVIAKEKDYPALDAIVKGPTAVAFSDKEINEVAKTLFAFQKESDKLQIKGGFVGRKVLSAKDVEALSKLPGRNQLIAMLMSTMNAPTQNFVACCNDVAGRLVRVLDQVAKQKADA